MFDNPLDQIPDIDFVPKDPGQMIKEMINKYQDEYYKKTGEKIALPLSSKERIFLNTQALLFYQTYNLIDYAAKMNTLKYSSGNYLDNLCVMLGISRREPATSITKVRFILSAIRSKTVRIPAGTRVSPGNKVFFATTEDTEIKSGETTTETAAICQIAGRAGNGYDKGEINILVDPLPYVAMVENVEASQGGADLETDESLRIRGYYALKGYSVAGPREAYEFWVREYSQAIEGVKAFSPEPGKVDIRVTLSGGEVPTDTYLKEIFNFIAVKRPLTDQLTIQAPEIKSFSLDFTYYIERSDRDREKEIKEAVNLAAEEYIVWQESVIGRDLNPDKLIALIVKAGAKRLDIVSPKKTTVSDIGIFKQNLVSIKYGGIEDD